MERTEMEMELHPLHSPSKDLICPGCGKNFTKDSDLRRHWRLPIPCQILHCTRTFRDDKLRAYLNHHASEHQNDKQDNLSQDHLESYFRGKGKELRHSVVPYLCVNKLGSSPKSSATYSVNIRDLVALPSTEHWNGFSSYDTVHANATISPPSLSAPETSVRSPPLNPPMNGLLHSPDGFLPSYDYGRGEGQPLRAVGPELEPYLKAQILEWKKSLRTKRHYSAYLQSLLTSNFTDEQRLENKIKMAEEELDKTLHAKKLESQIPFGHLSLWDALIADPTLDDHNVTRGCQYHQDQHKL